VDPEEVSGLFARMDINGDGNISLDEWRAGHNAFRLIGTVSDGEVIDDLRLLLLPHVLSRISMQF